VTDFYDVPSTNHKNLLSGAMLIHADGWTRTNSLIQFHSKRVLLWWC